MTGTTTAAERMDPLVPNRRRVLAITAGLAAAIIATLLAPPRADAQAYPTGPIRMIVPFPPGGGTDILARVIAGKLGETLGQQVIVDNRPGAGGSIGSALAAQAPADGQTLIMVSASYSVNAALFKQNFDPIRDLAAVIQIASVPFILTATPSLPANDIRELLALARAKPGSINFASTGNGSSPHLGGEWLALLSNTRMTHIPYKGGGPAITDVMGGQVQLYLGTVTATGSLIKAGKLKALGAGGMKRSAQFPNVPTIHESGVPGFDISNWFGILAPGATPKPIVAQLNRVLNGLLDNADIRAKLAIEGADPVGGPAEDFAKLIRDEIGKFTRIVKEARIQVN